ncbi:protein ORF51 [Lake sturgeon herpesvirus]|nr:protein ORF51 [Lake sturgeon herpesvirus]
MSTTRSPSGSSYSSDKSPLPSSTDGPSLIATFFSSLQNQPLPMVTEKMKKKKTTTTSTIAPILDHPLRRVFCSPTMTWRINQHMFQIHKPNYQYDLPLEGIVLSYFAAHCYWDRYVSLGLNPLMISLSPDSILDLTVVRSSWSQVTFTSDSNDITCLVTRAGHLKYISGSSPSSSTPPKPFVLPSTCLFYPTQSLGKCRPPVNVTVDQVLHRWTHRVTETFNDRPVAVTYLGDNLSPVTIETSAGSFFHKILALVYRFETTRVETFYVGQTLLDLVQNVTPAEGVCVCLTNCLTLPRSYPIDKNPNITLPSIGLSQYKHYMDMPIKPLIYRDVYTPSPSAIRAAELLTQRDMTCFAIPLTFDPLASVTEMITSVHSGSVLNWIWLGHFWNGSFSGLYGLYLWTFYTYMKLNPSAARGLMIWNELIEACASFKVNPSAYSAFYLYMKNTFFGPANRGVGAFILDGLSVTRHPQDLDAFLKTYMPDQQKWYDTVLEEGVYWTIGLQQKHIHPDALLQTVPFNITESLRRWNLTNYISFYNQKGGDVLDHLAAFHLINRGDEACALLLTNALALLAVA